VQDHPANEYRETASTFNLATICCLEALINRMDSNIAANIGVKLMIFNPFLNFFQQSLRQVVKGSI
jgi:hypothetical protein